MRLLTPCRHQNIVWEAFSGFNAQYPDIMHVRTCLSHTAAALPR
jgi:hypothetical protein